MEAPPSPMRPTGHVVAMPYPSRGHVNTMMSLCKLIASSSSPTTSDDGAPPLIITFVVTQEWWGLIGSEPRPNNIRFATIPNVIPLQSEIAADIPGFFQAAVTNIEDPFERLLSGLQPPVTAIIGDVELQFPVAVARRRNVPVAVLWTMSGSFYLMLHQLGSLCCNLRLTVDLLDDHEEHIPGISSAQLADLRRMLHQNDLRFLQLSLDCISAVPKADCLIVNTIQELEAEEINSLKALLPLPIYPIAFPYFKPETDNSVAISDYNFSNYLNWLDSQPEMSVLYISLGSFLSLSCAQMNQIASALNIGDVRYLWVAREEASWLKEKCGDKGLVVPWCDQLKVLSHPSVGEFWSHCGWNSTLEAVFAGVPMLTFPLFFDQVPNSRQILEGWKNGWELKRSNLGSEVLITQEEIMEVIRKFMDIGSGNGKEIRDRTLELKGLCARAVAEGGSSYINLDAFIKDVSCVHGY